MSSPSPSLSCTAATPTGAAPPLWRQLLATAQALQAVRGGQSATTALASVEPALRSGVQALLFEVLRSLGRADALRRALVPRKPAAALDALLCTALGLVWSEERAPYTPFTLVDQAVEAAKHQPALRRHAGLVNACLRRFLRERAQWIAASDADPVARWNHPAWWIQRLRHDYPQAWQRILEANNGHAPMALRVNMQKTTLALYLQALAAIDLRAIAVPPSGLVLDHPVPVGQLPGFADGWVSVQDIAAQQAAPLLLDGLRAPAGGAQLRVLDACAAPGGKTAHLLETARADGPELAVTALEIDPQRCERIHDTLSRLGLHARVIAADAEHPSTWWPGACDGKPFDAILLDAPCTASGIVRRHPDVRWLRRESDIAQLAATQARLLAALWPLLRPGGRLLYCTCSVFRAEGDAQIAAFLAHNTDATRLPSPGHLIPGRADKGRAVPDNAVGEHDGFFYALLQKGPA